MKSLRTFIQIHRSIKQGATIFSLMVVIMLFGLFMEAYMHDFNLVYITLFFVFSLAFSAAPIGVLNLGRLQSTFVSSGRLFAHQEGHISLNIYNSSTTSSWSIVVHGTDVEVPLNYIKGESTSIIHLPYIPEKRGTFTYENVYLESKYPLSTARLKLPIKESYEGLIYPEPKGKSLASFLSEEETHYGEEKEFDGLKEYDGSQRLSHIHWASVAKGELSVKTFTKETETPNLVFDFHKAGNDDESRLSQLTLWVLECEKKHLKFAIVLPHKYLNSAKESIDDILKTLARY
ncbi:DUF58 domain-containing protein [Sulfurovum sp.]|uniref:DUF58 domain-containing protein n=1 Tax=Sulfurovum sp. TaxID=1969726 RepID=UPI002867B16D|nr:DUF58 domain-containing protein [Sulfurovum sp.]